MLHAIIKPYQKIKLTLAKVWFIIGKEIKNSFDVRNSQSDQLAWD